MKHAVQSNECHWVHETHRLASTVYKRPFKSCRAVTDLRDERDHVMNSCWGDFVAQ